MRSADAATIFRTLLAIAVVYMIILKLNAALIIFLIALVMFLDAFDGFLAVNEESKGGISFFTYLKAAAGNAAEKKKVAEFKHSIAGHSPYGARFDVAGDRAVEYSFWIVFTYLHILPLYVLLLVVLRHSFVDAFMGQRGTSSKMKTGFAQKVYSSNIGRGGINVVKFITFAYLALVYVSNYHYPIVVGYMLTAVLLAYILIRGVAEIYDSTAK